MSRSPQRLQATSVERSTARPLRSTYSLRVATAGARFVRFGWLCALGLALGCGDDTGGVDGGSPFAPRIELGTSADHFEPIAEGATLEIEHGPQGGQHIWISVRAFYLSIDPAYVRMTLTRVSDGYTDGVSPTTVRVSVPPSGEGYTDVTGLRLFVTDRASLLDGDHEVRVTVTDSARASASAAITIRIRDPMDDDNADEDADASTNVPAHGDGG